MGWEELEENSGQNRTKQCCGSEYTTEFVAVHAGEAKAGKMR